MPTKQEIFENIQTVLVDALGVDEEDASRGPFDEPRSLTNIREDLRRNAE